MRIGVDLTFFTGTRGGSETYVRDLYTSLIPAQPEAEFVGIVSSSCSRSVSAWFPGEITATRIGGTSSLRWALAESLAVSRLSRRLGLDLLHCPVNLAPPRATSMPVVLTLHDVNAFRAKATPTILATRACIKRSFLVADSVITDSQWSADEIRRLLPSSSAPITVIPPIGHFSANRDSAHGDVPRPRFLEGVRADRPIVFSGGNRLPHKNWDNLLHAFRRIPSVERPALVLTGHGGAKDPVAATCGRLRLEQDVVLTGWTSTADMEWLYRHAALYVLPTRYEGFGLGVLEAMSRGCPVLASDISVLREVGGGAIEYVDSTDPAAMATAVARLLRDPSRLERLAQAGLGRAAEFSPLDTTTRTWDVFVDAMESAAVSS